MQIRKAASADREKIYGLLCELEGARPPYEQYCDVYRRNLGDPAVSYFVCEEGGDILAFSSLHLQYLLHHCSQVAEIQEFVVKSEYKGKGIGCSLFEAMKKAALESGCTPLEVCCNQKRKQSHGFYEHIGMANIHFKFTYDLKQKKLSG